MVPMASPCDGPLVKRRAARGSACSREDGEHRALTVVIEMEEAVPGDQAMEAAAQRQGAHVGHQCLLMRKIAFKKSNHLGSRVDPGDGAALLFERAGDRLSGAAADVEHRGVCRKESAKPFDPVALLRTVPSSGLGKSVSPIEVYDPVSFRGHGNRLTQNHSRAAGARKPWSLGVPLAGFS